MRVLSFVAVSAVVMASFGTGNRLRGQTFAASTGTEAVIDTPPLRNNNRVNVPGHAKNADENRLYGRVRDGVYTVDGMVAKVQLNYDVNGANFLYLFLPGVGTAVVSVVADPGAVTTEARLHENELSFATGDHRFNLTGVTLASNKGTAPAHLYVKLDRAAWRLGRHPMVGFGSAAQMPYVWPAALAPASQAQTEPQEPRVIPPVPASLLPSTTAVVPSTAAPASVDPGSLRPVSFE